MANFKDIIAESFSQYSGAVLQSRALIDVRDGLKPSPRQIFYAMETDKFTYNKPFKKTLKAIGSAVRFYIHGDASAEGIIMRSGQPFAMRYPLIEVEGSYGNLMETANWAAPRYTASRLSKISEYLFLDIKKDTISDWRDNYDDTEKYPAVLPTKGFYNLVNGTMGIGVGMSASIPQFNIVDLNNALITLLNNPDATFDEIYCAPDFATGGILINENAVKDSLRCGNGKACMLRAKIDYDSKKHTLTVVEMPYSVYTNTICKQLEAIVNSEENPGIDSFNDLTGSNPCIRIYLDKKANPEVIKNYLYKNTSLQASFGINMTMLDMGKHPKVFTWKEALQAHLEHEKIVYRRGYEYDLKKIAHDIKIAEAIIKAIAKIEEVIQTIKSASSTREANEALQKLLSIDEEQAKAILDIKLARLARLEVEKYQNELVALKAEKDRIEKILASEELFNAEIIKTFNEVSKKFGDKRRTEVTNIEIPKEEKQIAEVIPEDVVIVATQTGLIKKVPLSTFKVQKKGGKGIKSQDDIILDVIKTNTVDTVMFFTSKGKMYRIIADNIPEGSNSTRGVLISDLVKLDKNEKVIAITSLHRKTTPKYVIFVTKNGMIKKSYLEEYTKTNRNTGISALTVKEDDSVVDIIFQDEEDMLLITKQGMSIRFKTKDITPIGRVAMGVKGIKLAEGDEVVSALPIHKETDQVAVFTSTGLGKKVKLEEFPLQAKNGKGTFVYKPSESSGDVIGAAMVSDDDNILISGTTSSICISAKDIPSIGKPGVGNILIKSNKVISVTKI